MPIVKTVNGSLLDSKEPYIAQQCNCCTVKPRGLSATISKQLPWADVYSKRNAIRGRKAINKSKPGTIQIDSDPANRSIYKVIHMFAQYAPGKPGRYQSYYPSEYDDDTTDREMWFSDCLKVIDEATDISTVAMPYLIGCGLAGGSWKTYEKMLQKAKTDIVLYKL